MIGLLFLIYPSLAEAGIQVGSLTIHFYYAQKFAIILITLSIWKFPCRNLFND